MHLAKLVLVGLVCSAASAACGGEDLEPGGPCGGFTGQTCAAGLYCDYPANTCGEADEQGTCRVRPESCDDIYQPVCGCDGEVHGNACDAAAAGADLDDTGGCTAPLDTFRCGHRFCASGTDYCEVLGSDVAGVPSDFDCVGVPAGCGGAPDCACLEGERCGGVCEPDGQDVTLICPGG